MSINILCKGNLILRLKNILFDFFHQNLMKVVAEKNIELNEPLKTMLIEMDQNTYGYGCVAVDINDYIKTKQDLILFLSLLEDTVEKCKKDAFAENAIEALWQFHEEIVKYGESLKQ